MHKKQVGEETLAAHLRAEKIEFEREYRFAAPRRWRVDFYLPQSRLCVEVEGGAWSGGRHTRGGGFISDMEKYNELTQRNYALLRFTPGQVKSGRAIAEILRYLRA